MTRALLGLAFAICCGCSSYQHTARSLHPIQAPSGLPAEADLLVGTARVDVTPAPGPSTFGHGPDAHVASGYWSRLYCRVFVIETAASPPVALVPCDLAAISVVLHRKVGSMLEQKLGNDSRKISADRVMLSATHTHHGPAHYLEGPAYGGITSTRTPGYDAGMVDWLAERISNGIVLALRNERPARAQWVHTEHWGLTRNRSLHAHRMNGLPPHPSAPADLTESQKAIDPALHVLQFEELSDDRSTGLAPLGWLAWYAMHPTVMPAPTRMFHADAFGVASRSVEHRLNQLRTAADMQGEALVGIVNTNEGNVSPSWIEGTTDESIRIGEQLAGAIWGTHAQAGAWRSKLRLDVRYLERDLPGAPLSNDKEHLCKRAMLGASSIHGASDHPCTFDRMFAEEPDYDPDAKKGNEDEQCHAPKRNMMGWMQHALITEEGFPTHVPLALVRIDDTFLAHVPAELTVAAGQMVTGTIRSQIPALEDGRPSHAVVSGLSNGYIQYVTTEREYQVQTYEGGSTLYGPKTAAYLAGVFELLARSMRFDLDDSRRPRIDAALPEIRMQFAAERERLARPGNDPKLDEIPCRKDQKIPVCTILKDPPTLCMKWLDGSPGRVEMARMPAWIRLMRGTEPVRIEARTNLLDPWSGTAAPSGHLDDRGLGFQTHARDPRGKGWMWTSVWRPTRQEWNEALSKGKVVLMAGDLSSHEFGPEILDMMCSPDRAAECIAD